MSKDDTKDKLKRLEIAKKKKGKGDTVAPLQERKERDGKGGRPADFPDSDTKMIRIKLPFETLKAMQKAIPDTEYNTYSTFINAAVQEYIENLNE